MLANPDPSDWLSWRRTLDGHGHSPLDQINVQNVRSLKLEWSWGMDAGVSQTTPLVHNGVLYVASPGNVIHALDGRTGQLRWEYRREGNDPLAQMRNLAIYQDLVYLNTGDGHIVALDARTGAVRWDTEIRGNDKKFRFTSGPIVADGVVIAGLTGCGTFADDTCYIVAVDGRTGRELWRTSTIARPGEPGGDSWSGLPLMYRAGGDAWIPGSYDPVRKIVYWGTAQAKPWHAAVRGTDGEALYTNSTLAIDPKTGKVQWYFQHIPRESHDMDETFERILIDYDGKRSVFSMGKLGILWELDRTTGRFVRATDLGYQTLVDVDPENRQGELPARHAPRTGSGILHVSDHGWLQEPPGHGVRPGDRGAGRAGEFVLPDGDIQTDGAPSGRWRRGPGRGPQISLSPQEPRPDGRGRGGRYSNGGAGLATAPASAVQHLSADDSRRRGVHRKLGPLRVRIRRRETAPSCGRRDCRQWPTAVR